MFALTASQDLFLECFGLQHFLQTGPELHDVLLDHVLLASDGLGADVLDVVDVEVTEFSLHGVDDGLHNRQFLEHYVDDLVVHDGALFYALPDHCPELGHTLVIGEVELLLLAFQQIELVYELGEGLLGLLLLLHQGVGERTALRDPLFLGVLDCLENGVVLGIG